MIQFYEIMIGIFTFGFFFFSLSETAIVSANRSIILSRKERGVPFASSALYIIDRADESLSMILIWSNISSISATVFITLVATKFFYMGETYLILVTIVQTIVFLVFCEALPKIVSRFNADTVISVVSWPLRILLIISYPIVKGSMVFGNVIKKSYQGNVSSTSERSRDEINSLFTLGKRSGVIDATRRTYIDEILSLHRITVIEAMTPTIKIVSIEVDSSIETLLDLIAKKRFSRIPVYEKRVDNIIGYVYYRDLIENDNRSQSIRDLMSKPDYVPLTKSLYALYREMQTTKNHIVFAVNEYGAVVGMVTREDIAEEIVGEIQTRDHHREDLIKKNDDGTFIFSGLLDIDVFARILSINIEKKGFETVSGFISYIAGRIPEEGSEFEYKDIIITVEKTRERTISEIYVKKKPNRQKKNA